MQGARDTIRDLAAARLPWPQLHQLMSAYKDRDRFEAWRAVLQEQVDWPERIVLPLSPKLLIVDAGDRGVVKCVCGHVFCDHRENWKEHAAIFVRRSEADLAEVFGRTACDPDWMEVRELLCPGCWTLLEVEAAVPGYPLLHDFRPNLAAFYADWLGEEPPGWAT